jgi:hypothetical protein
MKTPEQTHEEIQQRIDEAAREYHATDNPKTQRKFTDSPASLNFNRRANACIHRFARPLNALQVSSLK